MTTPDLTSTPKFKLWSYIVVVAQMRWTTTKLQKDEEEENRDERRRRGNVHGDFQLYYTRHMCCCMLLLFFLDDMETSICIENVSIFDCFFKKLNIAQFRYKMMFPCRLHKRTLEQQQHAVAHVSRTLNETIMKILDVVVCYVMWLVTPPPATYLLVILHGRGSRHFGYKLWLFIIEMKDNWVCKTWLKDQKSYI